MAVSAFEIKEGMIGIMADDLTKVDNTLLYGSGMSQPNQNQIPIIAKGARIKILSIQTEDLYPAPDGVVTFTSTGTMLGFGNESIYIVDDIISKKVKILTETGYELSIPLPELCKMLEVITPDNDASKVLYGQK